MRESLEYPLSAFKEATERLPLGTRLEGRVRVIPLDAGEDRVALVRAVTELAPIGRPPPLVGAADGLRAGFLELMQPFEGDGGDLLRRFAYAGTAGDRNVHVMSGRVH